MGDYVGTCLPGWVGRWVGGCAHRQNVVTNSPATDAQGSTYTDVLFMPRIDADRDVQMDGHKH